MAQHATINGKSCIITNPIEVNSGYVQFRKVTSGGLDRVIEVPKSVYTSCGEVKYCGDNVKFIRRNIQ